jgi:hypothetical protein
MRRNLVLIGIAAILAALALQGCSNSGRVAAPNEPEPPSLPSVNTMKADVSLFESAQVDAQSVRLGRLVEPALSAQAYTKLNFLNAAVRVLFLDVVVYAALAQPTAAFATAIHSVPQRQDDGSWLWTYIYVGNGSIEYSVFLRGKQMDSYVAWSMEVSSTDPAMPLDHFLWFDGQVQSDERAGYWQFYEPVVGSAEAAASIGALETPGTACIRIDWENHSRVERRLAFLVNKPDAPEEGSTLVFDETLEAASIEFYDATNGNTGTIIWHRDGSGSIEWPDYNGGVKGCWDVWQRDVVCP